MTVYSVGLAGRVRAGRGPTKRSGCGVNAFGLVRLTSITTGSRLDERPHLTVAKKLLTQLIDDIDGTVIDDESGASIEFSVNGVEYLLDLKAKNTNEFHRKIGYYIEHATRVGGRKRKNSATSAASPAAPSGTGATRDPAQTRAIRQWAADNGYEISDRGRIPAAIEEAFTAAH